MPGGELERVLDNIFGPSGEGGPGLGDVDPSIVANIEQDPGTAYAGGPQTQRGGPAGKVAQAFSAKIDAWYGGIDPSKCPAWLTPECLDVLSRMLETTFRNFQQTARLPSHINPPFPARCIDVITPAAGITLVGGATDAGAFFEVVCFSVPRGRWRGVIKELGHALENLSAWDDVEWRVTLNGRPLEPYQAVTTEVWDMALPSNLCSINLLARDTICLEARSLSVNNHTAFGRLFGWYYPVRAEVGSATEIRATIVD